MNTYKTLSLVIVYFFLSGGDAFAYLDPGSGGFILQMLVAFVASLIIFFKNGMAYLKNFFLKMLNFRKKKIKNFN